ncbi:hypothetical protein FKP32DRAFT_1574802, partial [Trametes sanguinea]
THFNCDRVEFCAAQNATSESVTLNNDMWRPAQVSVSELLDSDRWLMVVAGTNEDVHVLWRHIKDGWTMACDERTLTMIMQSRDASNAAVTIQKLRFALRADFWSFVAHVSFARTQASVVMGSPATVAGTSST